MKKEMIIVVFGMLVVLLIASNAYAINLEIEKTAVNDVVISELSEPAVFNFHITNRGQTDYFEIYSLTSVEMSPKGTFQLISGETRDIEVKVSPSAKLKENTGIINFIYSIRSQNSGTMDDTMTIKISKFKDAVEIGAYNLNPESQAANIYVQNKYGLVYPQLKARFTSVFFDEDETFSLNASERKEFSMLLDKEKIKGIVAGKYTLTGEFQLDRNVKQSVTGVINFVEKSGISTKESSKGIIFHTDIIEKTNDGNVLSVAEVTLNKDVFSRLFTRFSPEPTKVTRKGLVVKYYWSKQLRPGENFIVNAGTNYLYPVIIIVAIIVIAYLIFLFKSANLVIKKRVNFVKAKGGEFALKVSISVSSKKFLEKISLIDRLPGIVKIYERFGTYTPDKIDERNRRIEWIIESLQPGEERVFSYIIYSKVGVVGRFELPPAVAIYEKDGKIKESSSNRAFFMNEPRNKED